MATQTLERLTHEEDGMLRRLHFFEQSGASLAPPFVDLKLSLLARDLRHEIREPFELQVLHSA